jgi:hypothetical protein
MKQIANNYIFNATAKTVTLNNLNIPLSQILMVAAKGKVFYSFADGAGAANYVQGENSILTLRSTTGLTNTDKLTIFYDDDNSTYNNVYGSTLNSENNIKINNINSGWGTRIAPANIGRVSLKIKSSQNVKVIFGYDLNSLKLKAGNKFIQFLEKFAIELEANTEYSFDKEIATTGPIFAWVDQGRDPEENYTYNSQILLQETSTLKRESDLTSIIGEIEPAVDPVIFISTDEASLDILPENNANYVILDTDVVNTFDMILNGVEKVTFTDSFDANDFKNCKLTITTTPQVSANKTQVFVTESVVLSTIKNEFFTFFYYNTGSIIAGIAPSTELDPLNVPTGNVLTNVLAKEPDPSLCIVTTIAGQKYGESRFIEGSGNEAYFGSFQQGTIILDTINNKLLASDYLNKCIRTIDLNGTSYTVNTLVGGGDPQPQPTLIYSPDGLTEREKTIYDYIIGAGPQTLENLVTSHSDDENPPYDEEEILDIISVLVNKNIATYENGILDRAQIYDYPLGFMGSPNQMGGNGRSALFGIIGGMSKDSQNNFYVSDSSLRVIRKITPSGVVTTYAGVPALRTGNQNPPFSNQEYFDSNNKLQAIFNHITKLQIDSSDNIYVWEWTARTIRKINASTGAVTTFLGDPDSTVWDIVDGTGSDVKFYMVHDMAIDKTNNVMYTSETFGVIRKTDLSTAEVTTIIEKEQNETQMVWSFGAIAFNSTENCLYMMGNNLHDGPGIYKLSLTNNPNKTITKYAGSEVNGETDGKGFEASILTPALCIDESNGNLYLLGKTCIRKITPI